MKTFLALLSLISAPKAPALCNRPQEAVQVATLDRKGLKENSGIDFSRKNPGIFWAVNDQGKTGDVFAIGIDGKNYGRFTITGATNIDWEDISLASCFQNPAKDCLYISDTGDNELAREFVTIYVVEEPANYQNDGTLALAQTINFKLPTPHNIEAMAVNEAKKEFYFITKNEELTTIFSLPYGKELVSVVTTIEFDELQIPLKRKDKIITAADFDSASQTLLLGSKDNAFEMNWGDTSSLRKIKIPKMDQPEAIAYYWMNGKVNIASTSEGKMQPLYVLACE